MEFMGLDWKEKYEREAILYVISLFLWQITVFVLKQFKIELGWIGSLSVLGMVICICYLLNLLFIPDENEKK